MDWLNADYKNLGQVLIGIVFCLLAFGWSAIFWYAARTLAKLRTSVNELNISVARLFDRFENHTEDLREMKRRVDRLERRA